MNPGIMIFLVFWGFYSVLTIRGVMGFPAYDLSLKIEKVFIVLAIPIYGAYLANKDMGYRFTEAAKKDIAYELPWWSNITFGSPSSSDFDDD